MLSVRLGRLIDISGAAIFLFLLLYFAAQGEAFAAIGCVFALSGFLISIWIGSLRAVDYEITWEWWLLLTVAALSALMFLAVIFGVTA